MRLLGRSGGRATRASNGLRGSPRRFIRPAWASATTSANMSSIASAGVTSICIRASPVARVGEGVRDAGRRPRRRRPGSRDERAQPEPEAHAAARDLEALGLDRVDVRDRDLAALAQREVEREPLAAGATLGEREALARDRVLERRRGIMTRPRRGGGGRTRRSRAAPGPARAARRPVGCALRPSSTSREQVQPSRRSAAASGGAGGEGLERDRRRSAAARPVAAAISATASAKRSSARARSARRPGRRGRPRSARRRRRRRCPRRRRTARGTSPAGRATSPAQHALEQEVLAEVLREPAAAHDGPLGAGGRHARCSARCGLGLAAAGQQHQPLHAGGAASAANAPTVSAAPGTARSG